MSPQPVLDRADAARRRSAIAADPADSKGEGAGVTPAEAVARAQSLLGKLYPYVLGTGNHNGPTRKRLKDGTLSPLGFDCWGFAGSWAYEQPRHEPGFNVGAWATVSDDRNCDSAIEDAEHKRQGYEVIDRPEIGCLLVMPSVRGEGGKRLRIGHVWLVVGVPAEWDPARPQYDLLETLQCQASVPPAIKRGPGPRHDGRTFRGRTMDAWRIRMLRVIS